MITSITELSITLAAVSIIELISLRLKILNRTGLVAALLVGTLILAFGGARWLAVMLTFYAVAVYFTKYKYEKKSKMGTAEAKGGTRGWQNVVSHGASASALAICYGLTSNSIFAAAYLGTIATSVADTLATEVGLLNISEPRLITRPHLKVRAGTSGGVTLLGEAASILGASLTALAASTTGFEGLTIMQIMLSNLLVGFLGSNFDSLLGATIQTAYKCKICQKITEEKMHCGQPTERLKGISPMDNNLVNFVSTIFGAAAAMLLYSYLGPTSTIRQS